MPVFQLAPDSHAFPSIDLSEPNGLLAVGGDLSPERLIAAYRLGIFPWYNSGEPILWWSPAPRLVLLPEEFHLPRRLARTMRNGPFSVTIDTEFAEVIHKCSSSKRKGSDGTWITMEMIEAYQNLHSLGYAHSVECWHKKQLVGGLYGLALGGIFFGESMFTEMRDASKIALATLVAQSQKKNLHLIDCQMTTEHLLRFGAHEISRKQFQAFLSTYIPDKIVAKKWRLE